MNRADSTTNEGQKEFEKFLEIVMEGDMGGVQFKRNSRVRWIRLRIRRSKIGRINEGRGKGIARIE